MALILYPLSVWQCNDLPKAYLPLYQPGTVSAQCGLVRNLSSIQPSWLVITGNNVDCRQLEKPGLKLHYASPAEAGERGSASKSCHQLRKSFRIKSILVTSVLFQHIFSA